jgi:hypothetical protein
MTTENGNGTQIAVRQPAKLPVQAGTHGLRLTNIDEMWRFAQAVATSGIAPRGLGKPEQILVALEYGAELGLRPMQSLATVMVVNGRATLWGDGMLAVAQASGLLEDLNETVTGDPAKPDTMVAKCQVKRRGRPSPSVATFSWKDARQAGLAVKDTYKQYPGRMLKARARAYALRDAFPDVLCGVLSSDEAQDFPDSNETVFVDGAQQPPTDLDALIVTDAGGVVDDPLEGSDGEQERDDAYEVDGELFGPPSDEDLARDARA